MARGVRLKNIKIVRKANGAVYKYRRVRGKFIRLPDLPENHPDFLRAYLDAENATPTNKNLGALIGQFLASPDFKARKASTQAVWRRRLAHIKETYGHAPAARIEASHVQKALKKLTPGAARSERTIWRALFTYAVDELWREDNPASHVRIAKAKTKPHEPWTPDQVETYRTRWAIGTMERQAFEVLFFTGARCVDAVKIGWQGVADGVLEFVQEKTGGLAYVPVSATVARFLDEDQAMFRQCASPDMLFILSSYGKGRTAKSLSNFLNASAKAAGVQRTAHGLRKSRAIILAENGWTPHQIGAWTGHESLSEIAHYTRGANKRAMVLGNQSGNQNNQYPQVIDISRKK